MADDPGGNFASDEHRRVMAAVPSPDEERVDLDSLMERVDSDDYLDIGAGEVHEILQDLEADGDVNETKAGWQNTKAGFKVLTGPIASDGGRKHGA